MMRRFRLIITFVISFVIVKLLMLMYLKSSIQMHEGTGPMSSSKGTGLFIKMIDFAFCLTLIVAVIAVVVLLIVASKQKQCEVNSNNNNLKYLYFKSSMFLEHNYS